MKSPRSTSTVTFLFLGGLVTFVAYTAELMLAHTTAQTAFFAYTVFTGSGLCSSQC
jgi:hypothetical protein